MRFNTKLLHGQSARGFHDGATLPQISQNNAFTYESAEALERVFQHKSAGYAYSRIGNPTIAAFERRISEIEGGAAAVACSSGMSAITLALLNILAPGDEIVAGSGLYGGTTDLFEDLELLGITVRQIPLISPEALEEVVSDRTRLVFGEVIGNPGLGIMDIRAAAEYLHERGIPLLVDSTTATPFLVNPILLGADIVIHSASKYINGGGNSIGGIIVDSGRFAWDFDRYQVLEKYKKYGRLAYALRLRTGLWENMGGCISPFHAYLHLVGLETLGLRMKTICTNARLLAEALDETADVRVNYPLLDSHPQKELARRQLNGYGGGILTIRAGSKERAYRLINHLNYARIASNIGDVRTLVIHPASTLFMKQGKEKRENAGVYDDLIRVSVGIEDIEDLIEDFREAIEASSK